MNNNITEQKTGDLYSNCFQKLEKNQWLYQGKLLADQLGLNHEAVSGKACLDGGCGHGSLVVRLAELGAAKVVGVDLAPTPPADALANLNNIEFIKTSLLSLPFPDNSFDLVVSSGVLHHTVDPEKCFKEMARVLKPGGIFILGVYGKYGLFPWLLWLARIFTVKLPLAPKRLTDWLIKLFKLNPIWRYQVLDYLYVPILKRYTVKKVINGFFMENNFTDVCRVSNITTEKAKNYNNNMTSYSYDHRKLINRILFGYGFIVVRGKKL